MHRMMHHSAIIPIPTLSSRPEPPSEMQGDLQKKTPYWTLPCITAVGDRRDGCARPQSGVAP
jgi:hypothetical protein